MASSSIASSSEALDFYIPERLYGRFAMIAFDLMIVSYLFTGQIIPGVFWRRHKLKNNYYVIYSYKQTLSPKTMKENAEMQNGRWAMVGILAAIGTYTFTGQIIPGIF